MMRHTNNLPASATARYLLERLGFYIAAAWVALTVNFFLPHLMPGDPATAMFARLQGKAKPEAIAAMREAFGLTDEPLWLRYWHYLQSLASFDLGISASYFPTPVGDVIGDGLLWTVLIAGTAVIVSFVLGTLLGIIIAWRRRGLLDSTLPPLFAFLGAFPYFWLAMLLLWALGFALEWFPLRQAYGSDIEPGWSWVFAWDVCSHAALPVLSIVLATIGGWMLSMRSTMISVLGSDYIRMAFAKGIDERTLVWRYAARNALLPNVTGFGMALGFVLGGSLLTEIVFSYPGTGYLLLQAVRNQDYALMQGLFMVITLAVLLANWLVDIVYLALDPRTRGDR